MIPIQNCFIYIENIELINNTFTTSSYFMSDSETLFRSRYLPTNISIINFVNNNLLKLDFKK